MSRLSPPSVGAKKPSSISPEPTPGEDDTPLLLLDPKPPQFEPPEPSPSLLTNEPFASSEISGSDIPPLLRAAASRAHRELGPLLRGIQDEQIWMVGINTSCIEVGRACIAQGGLSRVPISLLDLLVTAHMMKAKGIILLQNRPGSASHGVPIDALVTLKIAIVCELIGIPLIDHLYINTEGSAVSMRTRGLLKKVPDLLRTLREYASALAVKAWEEGRFTDEWHEKRKAAAKEREAAKERAPVDVISRQRR